MPPGRARRWPRYLRQPHAADVALDAAEVVIDAPTRSNVVHADPDLAAGVRSRAAELGGRLEHRDGEPRSAAPNAVDKPLSRPPTTITWLPSADGSGDAMRDQPFPDGQTGTVTGVLAKLGPRTIVRSAANLGCFGRLPLRARSSVTVSC